MASSPALPSTYSVATDRELSLRRAEKLLRQGRLDGAIEEYVRLLEEQPGDWNLRNVLGDLYVRAGRIDQAAAEFSRIADHFAEEGFFSRAVALYRKVVKIKPGDEHARLQSAEVAARQGLLADARAALEAIAGERERRGDRQGANEIIRRIADLDPSDFAARSRAARAVAETGDPATAARCYRDLAAELFAHERKAEAVEALGEVLRIEPDDGPTRDMLVRCYLQLGEIDAARAHAISAAQVSAVADACLAAGDQRGACDILREALVRNPDDRDMRGRLARALITLGDIAAASECLEPVQIEGQPEMLLLAAEAALRTSQVEEGRRLLRAVMECDSGAREKVAMLGCSLADADTDAAFACVEVAVDAAVERGEWPAAASALEDFARRAPHHVEALIRLVDVCVDGDLSDRLLAAQSALADCYLQSGRATEARVIAEDLVLRDRGNSAHLDRLRRSLQLLGEADPDAIIAASIAVVAPIDDEVVEQEQSAKMPAPSLPETPPELPPPAKPLPANTIAFPVRTVARAAPEPAPAVEKPDVPIAVGNPSTVEIDLSGVLRELKPTRPPMPENERLANAPDLKAVFREFRNEVARENVNSAAAEHYKLALAYFDMGMADECISALQVAVREPRLRFSAASLLARAHRIKGRMSEAIEWFERAAETPGSSPEAARDVLYELGQTLEQAGESARALAVYLELQADARDYRDVKARIDRLSRPGE